MNGSILEVIIIGAGHAGLSASYYLKHLGLEHVIFERGRIGESWRSRWDSFTMITSNRQNVLPGASYKGKNPDGFSKVEDFVVTLEDYAAKFQLPVTQNANVISIEKTEDSPYFTVTVMHDSEGERKHNCWQVIIASGIHSKLNIPAFANTISVGITQIHSTAYRNPEQFPEGAVLVVGSSQSGSQIAEELADTGRKVFLCTSKVPRVPRRYRGRDIVDWMLDSRWADTRADEKSDPRLLSAKVPLLSGIGKSGHSLSLHHLAGKGVSLLGSLENANESAVFLKEDLKENITYADEYASRVKAAIDTFIQKNPLQAIEAGPDEPEIFEVNPCYGFSVPSLDFAKHDIKSILWATGYTANFDFIRMAVLDHEGQPKHKNGITSVEGLYFLTYPGIKSLKSQLISGIKDAATLITTTVYSSLR